MHSQRYKIYFSLKKNRRVGYGGYDPKLSIFIAEDKRYFLFHPNLELIRSFKKLKTYGLIYEAICQNVNSLFSPLK
jgi:hypothetical protein